jgi:hypothetical protein
LEAELIMVCGIVAFGNGMPVAGSKIWICCPLIVVCEKSPLRSASVGTVEYDVNGWSPRVPL